MLPVSRGHDFASLIGMPLSAEQCTPGLEPR